MRARPARGRWSIGAHGCGVTSHSSCEHCHGERSTAGPSYAACARVISIEKDGLSKP